MSTPETEGGIPQDAREWKAPDDTPEPATDSDAPQQPEQTESKNAALMREIDAMIENFSAQLEGQGYNIPRPTSQTDAIRADLKRRIADLQSLRADLVGGRDSYRQVGYVGRSRTGLIKDEVEAIKTTPLNFGQ